MSNYLTAKEIKKLTGINERALKYARRMKYLKEIKTSPGKRIVYFELNEVRNIFPNAK